jgi:hypothetical protein
MSKSAFEADRAEYPEASRRLLPMLRAECEDGPRPCPYASCRHHLGIEVSGYGSIKIPFDGEPTEIEPSCSLDLADDGMRRSIGEVAEVMGLTRSRVDQIERAALAKLGRALNGVSLSDLPDVLDDGEVP